MAEGEERIDIRGDGRVILYKRPGLKNPKWQARIRVPKSKEYKIVSTKTANLKEAERFALDLYEDLYLHVKSGGSIRTKTFRQVFDEWESNVKVMGPNRQGGSWSATIDRVRTYALEFFGSMKITEIGQPEFTDFWAWRKSNFNRKPPSNGTLKRERTCILPLFKYARLKGYISKIPETSDIKVRPQRRPAITLTEWKTIEKKFLDWVNDGTTKGSYRERLVAMHSFNILAHTGMRIGELRTLQWKDVRFRNGYLQGEVRGKTGSREIIFNPGSEVCIKKLNTLRCKELEEMYPDQKNRQPDPESLIVCHRDGRSIGSFRRSFESLLNFCGISVSKNGMTRTVYSLRHLYATRQLSIETNPFLLAKQMGTSVEMLEKHYGQIITSSLAEEITKSKPANLIKDIF